MDTTGSHLTDTFGTPAARGPLGRGARGVADFLLALLCIWAAWHHTPAGALLRRAGAWALGARTSARAPLAYYDAASASGAPALAPRAPPPRVLSGPEALALGAHLAYGGLSAGERGPADALARELGLGAGALADTGGGPGAARRALTALAAGFSSEEARVVALFAGRTPAAYALDRVRAQGAEVTLEALAHQLPPGFEAEVRAAGQALALATAFGLGWPVGEGAPVTSPFGYREHPVLGGRRLHAGVDLGLPVGTAVRAVQDAVVRRASEDAVNGRVLVLDHGRGVTTAYCHNDALLVGEGDRVARGQVVARSGNTGRSTGPHLHYQLELDAQPVDPLRYRAGKALAVARPAAGE